VAKLALGILTWLPGVKVTFVGGGGRSRIIVVGRDNRMRQITPMKKLGEEGGVGRGRSSRTSKRKGKS